MKRAALHVFVEGLVQGVGFRHATYREARKLGLGGWVRNLSDGRVEIWAQGHRPDLEALLEWVRQGPPLAQVSRVDADWSEAEQPESDFQIRFA